MVVIDSTPIISLGSYLCHYTKSVFNRVINSQVMDCFSPLPTSPIPFKQDLLLAIDLLLEQICSPRITLVRVR
ncbi:MAG UNVERIFIED_CONTAM: hypothetical protein LVR29_22160 [Microcystis novacekii LVE1205-3]